VNTELPSSARTVRIRNATPERLRAVLDCILEVKDKERSVLRARAILGPLDRA